jgi:hypothetical protein
MQRSRTNWLQNGDRNTTFFANLPWLEENNNRIVKLKHDGNWVEGTNELKPIILQYFANLFTSEVQMVDHEL